MPSHRTYPVPVHPYAQPQTIPSPKFTPYAQPKNVPSPTFHLIWTTEEHSQYYLFTLHGQPKNVPSPTFHLIWPAEEHRCHIVRAVTLTRSQSIFIMMSASIHITFMFSTRPYALQDVPPVRHHPSTTSGDPTPSTPPTGGSLERGTERAKPGPVYPSRTVFLPLSIN